VTTDSRIPALDGLRGIAILLILILHSFGLGVMHSDGAIWKIFNAGWVGVDLFFVISGYLITGILLETRDRPGYFRVFFIRRMLRIFPPYYFVLAFVIVLGLAVPALHTDAFSRLLDNQIWLWTYTSNIKLAFTRQLNLFG
jgi:peptidoglycan/LPS O-acetylase OafA/YrhL